jgi:hypothetical protein
LNVNLNKHNHALGYMTSNHVDVQALQAVCRQHRRCVSAQDSSLAPPRS